LFPLSLSSCVAHPELRSFPTRRSSDLIIPESITVQELANRMTERAGDVVKSLMKMGVMATMNHAIDADTAELIVHEFGHTFKRRSEEHTSELQSRENLVCRLMLEKKKN